MIPCHFKIIILKIAYQLSPSYIDVKVILTPYTNSL